MWEIVIASEWTVLENSLYPAGIYMLRFNKRNTRTRCEICSKLTIKIPEPGVVQVSLFLRLRQKNGFLIKKTCMSSKEPLQKYVNI